MNILFLDIDGVLSSKESLINRDSNPPFNNQTSNNVSTFDVNFINNVNKICNDFDLKIIITSDWRWSGLKALQSTLFDSGLTVDIIDITPFDLQTFNRAKEIREWLNEHENINKFIILDDNFEEDFEMEFKSHEFVITSEIKQINEFFDEKIVIGFNNIKLQEVINKLNQL